MKKLALAIAAILVSSSALAQGFYFYGAAGQSSATVDKAQIDSDIRTVTGIQPNSSVDETDTAYKLQLGYHVTPYFAVEGGYVNLGTFSYKATVGPFLATENIKVDGYSVAAVLSTPIRNGFSLFGKLGAINAKVKNDVNVTGLGGSASDGVSDTSLKVSYGFGATWAISPKVSLRGEWERYAKLGDKDKTGQSDVDALTLGFVFGF